MKPNYLLYIDVLGFSDLVAAAPERVDDLFEVLASLHVHDHYAFATIAFSDTILIHNVVAPRTSHDHEYLLMYLCEFFADFLHRLVGRGIYLRGVLTYGEFEHYRLNDAPFFYGPALIRAYHAEKKLKVTGLLMDAECRAVSKIFSTRPFDDEWFYVFVTQGLDEFEDLYQADVPLPDGLIGDTDSGWRLGPELEMLAISKRLARDHPDAGVREKHEATLAMYRVRYPRTFAALESSDFRMEDVSNDFDWGMVRQQMMETYSWASKRTPPLPGGLKWNRSDRDRGDR